MKKISKIITLGLGLVLGSTLLAGCQLKGSGMAHADPEPAFSAEFVLDQSWGSDFGLYAWNSNSEPILGAWSDAQFGTMQLGQDGYYHQTVTSETDIGGVILRFKHEGVNWQSTDLVLSYENHHQYLMYGSTWKEDISGGKKCTTRIEDYNATHVYHLAGSPTSWQGYFATFENNTVTVDLLEDAEFKFVVDDWADNASVEAITNPGEYFKLSDETYRNIKVLKTGRYTFTLPERFFLAKSGVTFTYQEAEVPHEFGLIGDRSGWGYVFASFENNSLTIALDAGEHFLILADGSWDHRYEEGMFAEPGEYFEYIAQYDNILCKVRGTYTFTLPADFFTTGTGLTFTYQAPANPSETTNLFYVLDSNKVLGETLANVNVYGFGEELTIKAMAWPGTHNGVSTENLSGKLDVYRVELSVSYPKFLMNAGDGENQTADVVLGEHSGDVLVIDGLKEGETKVYLTHWAEVEEVTDFPEAAGYYIVGSETNFKYANAPKMQDLAEGDNSAVLKAYVAKADEKIKVRAYLEGVDHWAFYGRETEDFGARDEQGNFVFSKAVTVDVYAKWEEGTLKFYMAEHFGTDGFYAWFLEEIGGVCQADGSTNLETLKTKWAAQEEAFNSLTDEEKEAVKAAHTAAIALEGEGTTNAEKALKKYEYIVNKYGTANVKDFIKNRTIEANALVVSPARANETTPIVMIIVVASIAVISALSVTAIVIIKKRRLI